MKIFIISIATGGSPRKQYYWDAILTSKNYKQIPIFLGWHTLKVVVTDSFGQTTTIVWGFNIVERIRGFKPSTSYEPPKPIKNC